MALQILTIHRMDIRFQMDVVHDHVPTLFALPVHQRTQMQSGQFLLGKHAVQASPHQSQARPTPLLEGLAVGVPA